MHVAGPRVAVARLADAADVDHDLAGRQRIAAADLVGAEEPAVLGEDARHVRVPLKGIAVDQGEHPLQLAELCMSSGKTYSLSGLRTEPWTNVNGPSRCVRGSSLRNSQRLAVLLRVAVGHFELVAGPEDGPLGPARKAFRVVQRPLIVVAQDRQVEAHHPVDALPRVGAVADDIAQAIDAIHALAGDVGQDGFQGLQVGVNVADDGALHGRMPKSVEPSPEPNCMRRLVLDIGSSASTYRPDISRSPRALSRSGTA